MRSGAKFSTGGIIAPLEIILDHFKSNTFMLGTLNLYYFGIIPSIILRNTSCNNFISEEQADI
jgi:hypothetical protein